MDDMLALGSYVQTTWLVSLTAQVVTLGLAIAAVAKDDVRSAFSFVLVLELIVSSIQFLWYAVVYVLVFVRGYAGALENMWRYVDWTLTTPAMLITLNVLLKAWGNECASIGDIWTVPFGIGNAVAIVFNTAMLHGGYRVESGRVDTDREGMVLAMSTFYFFFAFLPSVIFVTEDPSVHGVVVLTLVWVVWACYALNLVMYRNETETRASIYNILDVFSKNVFAGKSTSKLLGESPESWGDVMVEMCKRADANGRFFNACVATRLLVHADLYTDAQRGAMAEAGFAVPLPGGTDGDGPIDGPDSSGSGGGTDSSGPGGGGGDAAASSADDPSVQFWGECGKRRLVARLGTLTGPGREFALHKPLKSALKRRKRRKGTATFSCRTCHIRHEAPLEHLARTNLSPDTYKCLCSADFSARDALSRRTGTSWRNLVTYLNSKRPDTELATTRDTFSKDYSSVVLRCKRCQSEKRVQPRDVFGREARCTACAAA